MGITCCIRYEIDPFQRDAFVQYADNWARIIPRCGGDLIGYFMPHEGTNTVAIAMISFASLAAYEDYRAALRSDDDGRANFSLLKRNGSSFARSVPSSKSSRPLFTDRRPMKDQAEKCRVFRELHASGCFLIPNPWDRGSARLLESLGFPALATTSSGMAWSLAMTDNHVPLDLALEHIGRIAAAVDIPVNADFEDGFATEPDGVASNVTRCVATGVAGLSIEDSTGDEAAPLFEFALAVERVRAARHAIDATGVDVLLTGRSEGFIAGRPDLAETIRRLVAYAEAGADVLYAPGIRSDADVAAVVQAVAPKPVNALVYSDFTTVADMKRVGVRRISVGGALARAAWRGAIDAAREILDDGTFVGLSRGIASRDLEVHFARER